MKMHEELVQSFNDAIRKELESAYKYEAMALWLRYHNLDGMAHWMHLQAEEELEHAVKFREYIELRGDKVHLTAIQEPKSEYKSALEAFEDGLHAEIAVTRWLLSMRELAVKHKDEGAVLLLDWFVREQEAEENTAQSILDKFTLAGITHETHHGAAIYLLDKELGVRGK
ncbi:ferritin [Entomospira entomophila]|uniref:Ferritin n=1 Tax=Entomospira entomophila TaxID=2719988 RepID=A0A968KT63_9SPIO|nr:ferritin [Entomospira entomophilus]NIZ41102.1 ferritin [Entomospira entomophilus]WDI35310.1 ferritin [Entomospira entomophilus]